jgi:hypothetical protein
MSTAQFNRFRRPPQRSEPPTHGCQALAEMGRPARVYERAHPRFPSAPTISFFEYSVCEACPPKGSAASKFISPFYSPRHKIQASRSCVLPEIYATSVRGPSLVPRSINSEPLGSNPSCPATSVRQMPRRRLPCEPPASFAAASLCECSPVLGMPE